MASSETACLPVPMGNWPPPSANKDRKTPLHGALGLGSDTVQAERFHPLVQEGAAYGRNVVL